MDIIKYHNAIVFLIRDFSFRTFFISSSFYLINQNGKSNQIFLKKRKLNATKYAASDIDLQNTFLLQNVL